MRGSIFDFIGNLDTLLAVILGAVLATGGALIAELIQDRLNQRRRERDAARFFGEILATVDRILDFAFHTQRLGDKWGSVSQRLFRTAFREAGVYERNRERLFDIRDMNLRTRIHSHFLVETVPLEALIQYCDDIEKIEERLGAASPPSPARIQQLHKRLEDLHVNLEQALTSLKNEHAKTQELCKELEVIAGITFDHGGGPVPSASAISEESSSESGQRIVPAEPRL